MQTKEFAWGVCNDDMGHNYASTSGILKEFLGLLFLLVEGWECQIQSVINEHFKRLIVATKMFKFIIMF